MPVGAEQSYAQQRAAEAGSSKAFTCQVTNYGVQAVAVAKDTLRVE